MDETAITEFITSTFPNVQTSTAFGYLFFFVGEDRMMPFATMAASDTEHDNVSNLDRPDVFRLNIGVSRETYRSMFGSQPRTQDAAGVADAGYDFAALDQVMPHPTYAAQSWVCVLNPGEETLPTVLSLLAEAHEVASKRNRRRAAAE